MNSPASPSPVNPNEEAAALIETILEAERRLVELTRGEVDTVAGRDGRTFLLSRAQEQLRFSDAARQSAIINGLPAHIALLDARGIIVSVNEAWRKFPRNNALLSPGHALGINYVDVCLTASGPDSAEAQRAAAGIRAVLNGSEPGYSVEYPSHSQGEQRWFLLTVTPLAGADRNGAVVMHLNITERMRAQKILQQATRTVARSKQTKIRVELLLLILAATVFYGLVARFDWFKMVTAWVFTNHAGRLDEIVFTMVFLVVGLAVFGVRRWRESELELTSRHQTQSAMELLHNGLETRIEQRTEELGRANRILSTEIAERTRASEALQQSEERFSAAFEQAPIGMALVSLEGRFLKVNQALSELVGYSSAELLITTFQSITHPDDLELDLNNLHRTVAGEISSYQMEKRYIHARGHTVSILLDVSLVRDARRQPLYFISQIQDISERKRAEDALRASESEFRALAEAMPQMVWITQADGWTIYFSKQWMDYTGLSLAESLGDRWIKAFHPDDRQSALDAWQQALATHGIYSIEARLRRADGSYRWWLTRGVPVRDAEGDILKWFGTCTDIHNLKVAEFENLRTNQELRDSEEKFQLLANNITDTFWIQAPDMREIHYISPAFERIWGRPISDLHSNPQVWADFTVPEDRERVRLAFEALTKDTESLDIEYRIARPSGEIRWIRVRGFQVRDAADLLIYLTGIVTDISDRKRTDTLLAESAQRLAMATDAAHMGIWDLDVASNEMVWNDQMYSLYGVRKEEFSGAYEAWQSTLHPNDRVRAEADFLSALHGLGDFRSQFRVIWRNGEVRHIEARGLAQRSESGSANARMIGVNWDITERKHAEAELEITHGKLLEASRLAGMAEVATEVLHNVGNVLNSVNVASSCVAEILRKSKSADLAKIASLLREHEADLGQFMTADPRGKHIAEYISQLSLYLKEEQVVVLKELSGLQGNIEHIKAIVKMQQNVAKVSGVTEWIKPAELVDDAVRINASGLVSHNIQVTREFEDMPLIKVQKHKLLQILINLVRNAKDACAGSVPGDRRINLRVSSGPNCVRIEVSDNGVGILPEDLTRIFAHGFTTKKDGHGFGLHSSILAAQDMGADLTVHSGGIGTGATFKLEVPCKPGGL